MKHEEFKDIVLQYESGLITQTEMHEMIAALKESK